MNTNAGYFDFVLPTKLIFGPGKRSEVLREIESLGFQRVGIVTTDDILELGLGEDIVAGLREAGREVKFFSDVTSNPHLATVKRGYNAYRQFDPDCLIGLGGGSVIDTAKSVALCLANREEEILTIDDGERDVRPALPYLAVPTTSGTGSEVDYWAVISDPETKKKLSIGFPEMSPLSAIVDPELTQTLPPEMTFYTGMDAFSHALEAYFSAASNELSDLLAVESMKLVRESLPEAVRHGKNLKARGDMALASTLGGAAMQHVGLGLVHAMSHQVSGFYDTNHGLANALLIPPVLEFNREEVSRKAKDLASVLGGEPNEVIEDLLEAYPNEEFGATIREADLDEMAERAASNVNAETNPRPVSQEEIIELYRKSFTVS